MSTREQIQKRRRKKQRQNDTLLWMMGIGTLLVIAAIVYAVISSNQIEVGEIRSYQQDGLSGLGDPDAPVVIQEFSDFGCSHCADFALETKKILVEEYIDTGIVYLQYSSVGGFLQSFATLQAAEAAYCAGEQEAFWQYHDLLFLNQSSLFSNRSADNTGKLVKIAETLDLDADQFRRCLVERKYLDQAALDESLARGFGVTGTPAFLINGLLLTGNQPIENFRQAIDQALEAIAE
jgi:protein-disulfide isomerase